MCTSASDPNQKAIYVTSKHRSMAVPELGKQSSREGPCNFMQQQTCNNDSTIEDPMPQKVSKLVIAPLDFGKMRGRDQSYHFKVEDTREYHPTSYEELHPKSGVNIGKGSKRELDSRTTGQGVRSETANVTLVLDPFKFSPFQPPEKSKTARGKSSGTKTQQKLAHTARERANRSPTRMHERTVAEVHFQEKKTPMRDLTTSQSPTHLRKVPGPGQYDLPELPRGRAAGFQPLPKTPKSGRRRSPTHCEEEEEMMMGAYGFINTDKASNAMAGPPGSTAGGRSNASSKKSKRSSKGGGNGCSSVANSSDSEVGPGAYKLPSCFDKPNYGWTPRGTFNGSASRKENQGLGVDLFQASLRPGPGQYNVASVFGKAGRRERKAREEERFHPFCSKPKPPLRRQIPQPPQQQPQPQQKPDEMEGVGDDGAEEGNAVHRDQNGDLQHHQ